MTRKRVDVLRPFPSWGASIIWIAEMSGPCGLGGGGRGEGVQKIERTCSADRHCYGLGQLLAEELQAISQAICFTFFALQIQGVNS